MSAIDTIQPPTTFWYEDEHHNRVPYDLTHGFPETKWKSQHSKGVLVQESIVFGEREIEKDRWPVRFIKWLLRKMPDAWKRSEINMTFNTTINHSYPLVKYLVERRQFKFYEACVVAGDLCGRCSDIVEAEMNGHTPNITPYDKWPNSQCSYCEQIDPEYVKWRRVWCCYRTMALGGIISKAYKETAPNSGKD